MIRHQSVSIGPKHASVPRGARQGCLLAQPLAASSAAQQGSLGASFLPQSDKRAWDVEVGVERQVGCMTGNLKLTLSKCSRHWLLRSVPHPEIPCSLSACSWTPLFQSGFATARGHGCLCRRSQLRNQHCPAGQPAACSPGARSQHVTAATFNTSTHEDVMALSTS